MQRNLAALIRAHYGQQTLQQWLRGVAGSEQYPDAGPSSASSSILTGLETMSDRSGGNGSMTRQTAITCPRASPSEST